MSRIIRLLLLAALAPAALAAQADPILESRAEFRSAAAAYEARARVTPPCSGRRACARVVWARYAVQSLAS